MFSSDDKAMFLSIGSATNVATQMGATPREPLPQWEAKHGLGAAWGEELDRALVLAFDPDGSNKRTFATGLRNCVGLLVYPEPAISCAASTSATSSATTCRRTT